MIVSSQVSPLMNDVVRNSRVLCAFNCPYASPRLNMSEHIFIYGDSYAFDFSVIFPGRNPISLVGTTLRTIETLRLSLFLFITSSRARYKLRNVLPVPAHP